MKIKERKLIALYSQSKVELDKVERRLSSGIEWLASVPLKLCSETEIKLDMIETRLSENIAMLSNMQLKLHEKQCYKVTDLQSVHELKGMEKKKLDIEMKLKDDEQMLASLKSEPQLKSQETENISEKSILDANKKGSDDDQMGNGLCVHIQ